jgi:hypothetical protein
MQYSHQLAAEICRLMADEGLSLRQICARESMPARSSVHKWLNENKDFADQYARARETMLEAMADEILDIADDQSGDTVKDPETGYERADTEWINRSRLRVDSRKWLLSKLLPKKYGDKLELSGNKDAPVTVEIVRFTEPK